MLEKDHIQPFDGDVDGGVESGAGTQLKVTVHPTNFDVRTTDLENCKANDH
jgi:hypothetical protein